MGEWCFLVKEHGGDAESIRHCGYAERALMAQGVAFISLASFLCVLASLVVAGSGVVRLESRLGVTRDGRRLNTKAPPWSLADIDGRERTSPSSERWQLLIFADHSLIEFPGVISGIRRLRNEADLEIFRVSSRPPELVRAAADALKLGIVTIAVPQSFYHRFNVRVMPFAFFIDPDGLVREQGIVNYEETLINKWLVARAASDPMQAAFAPTGSRSA